MPEFTPEDQERAKAWLREQVKPEDGRKGLSTYKIRDILKPYTKKGPSQSTVVRAVQALEDDEDLEKTITRAIMALFAFEEAEAKRIEDAKAAVTQPSRDVDDGVASTERAEVQPTADDQADERQKKLVHDQLRAVIARQVERGIVDESDLAQGIVRGDGEYYLRTLQTFFYQDPGAEKVGFADKDQKLPDGRTADYYTEGVNPEWRQRKWAVPMGASRNGMIGKRPANLVTVVPYYDDGWFWAYLKSLVDSWRAQLGRFESWITDGVPKNASKEDVAAYEELLRLTAHFSDRTVTYEGPAPDVTRETVNQAVAVLWLKIRRREDAAKAAWSAVRLVGLGLLGVALSWALLSVAPDLISLRATVEGWRTTGWQLGAESLLLLASPWALAVALVACILLFLISAFYTRKLMRWERKAALRWTIAFGVFVLLVAAGLVLSAIAFEALPGLERVVASSQAVSAPSR